MVDSRHASCFIRRDPVATTILMNTLRFHAPVILAASLLTSAADEDSKKLTIQPGEFIICESFSAKVFPSNPLPVAIGATSWTAYEITAIAPHGAAVSKGDVLLEFAPEELTRRIEDLENAVARRELEIATATLELTNLRETADERLAASRLAAEQAADDHDYYVNTRQAVDIETAEQSIKRATQRLLSTNEELVQLQRMYEADDLVEETEEMILTRQRDAVEAAEFALRVEKLSQARRLGTTLPRYIETLEQSKRDTARKLATDVEEIPRTLALRESALAEMTRTQARERELLQRLTDDRAFLAITAPADGMFYYGSIENGEWTTGELLRSLVVGGRPPVKRPLATFIPGDATLEFHAHLDEAAARSFGGETPSGLAILAGRGDVSIPVTVASISAAPSPALRHHAVLNAEWPDGVAIAPGASAEVHLIAYANPEAILVPANAVTFSSSGWEVEVKLADGKTENRTISRGRAHGGKIEILEGLEAGQVIVLP